jgi:tetratricopeptide (TPR) repeat protein
MKRSALCVAVLLATAPFVARAQAAPEGEPAMRASPITSAHALYNAGRFQEALEKLQAEYAKNPLPRFLQNIGQCQLRLGQKREALENFQLVLRTDPKLPQEQREAMQQLVAKLTTELGLDKPTEVTRVTPVYKKWWFWTLLGTAAAGATAGITVAVLQSQQPQASSPEPRPDSIHDLTWYTTSTRPVLLLQGSW